jgi:hypothetical protein
MGLDCLDIRTKLGLDGIQMPGLPKGSVVDQGHAVVDMEGAFPLDAR